MIKFTSKRLENKLSSIIRKLETQKEKLIKPQLRDTIKSLKALVNFDPEINNLPKKTHNVSRNLLKNTRVETVGENREELRLLLGFFIEYGKNLEEGSEPHDPGFDKMLRWARSKGYRGVEAARVAAKMRNYIINNGSNGYNVIGRVWESNKEDFRDKVYQKIREVFGI